MQIGSIETHRTEDSDTALAIEINGRRLALVQAVVAGRTDEEIAILLQNAATVGDVELPEVHVHVNRDGSLAMCIGPLHAGFVWPEDWETE